MSGLFDKIFLRELEAKIILSEVVREFVVLEKRTITPDRATLKKFGLTRKEVKAFSKPFEEWLGSSPFVQDDENESLAVNDKKHRWFDFASGKNGTAIVFLVQMGRTYQEAVEELAKRYNITVVYEKADAD